jgi:hypothetical protein
MRFCGSLPITHASHPTFWDNNCCHDSLQLWFGRIRASYTSRFLGYIIEEKEER